MKIRVKLKIIAIWEQRIFTVSDLACQWQIAVEIVANEAKLIQVQLVAPVFIDKKPSYRKQIARKLRTAAHSTSTVSLVTLRRDLEI